MLGLPTDVQHLGLSTETTGRTDKTALKAENHSYLAQVEKLLSVVTKAMLHRLESAHR